MILQLNIILLNFVDLNQKDFFVYFIYYKYYNIWLWNTNHQIKKEDYSIIILNFKKILYANLKIIINAEYKKF